MKIYCFTVYMCGMECTFQIYWISYDFLILIKVLLFSLHVEFGLGVCDLTPVEVTSVQRANKHLGGCNVGRNGNVMKVTKSQQVQIVISAGIGGISEEEEHIYLVEGNSGSDLLGASGGAGKKTLYFQSGSVGNILSGNTRSTKIVLT